MAIRFDNLPLFEVTVRLTLADALPVGFPLVLDLADRLEREVVVDDALIEVVPGAPFTHNRFGPAVAYGFEGGCSVHLQPYLMVVRWRGTGSDLYVGFSILRELAQHLIAKLTALLGAEPAVSVVNMTYSNFITGDIRPMLKVGWLPTAREENVEHWESVWNAGEGHLRIVVDRGVHEGFGGSGFVLSCTAGRILGESESYLSSLDKIHGILCTNFVSMITDDAKLLWQFKNS